MDDNKGALREWNKWQTLFLTSPRSARKMAKFVSDAASSRAIHSYIIFACKLAEQ